METSSTYHRPDLELSVFKETHLLFCNGHRLKDRRLELRLHHRACLEDGGARVSWRLLGRAVVNCWKFKHDFRLRTEQKYTM